uniref:Class I SAM-dependent methyltransferase n=1 Tax=Thermofilum pendens TaxID=2269 RepID=A0A7C4FE75_THEPE
MLLREQLSRLYKSIGEQRSVLRALDVGTGAGENLRALLGALPEATVLAIDVDADALRSGLATLPRGAEAKLEPVLADARALPLRDGSFDLVASLAALHHLDDVERALVEASRVLREGGYLVIAEWTPGSRLSPHPPDVARRTLEEIRRALPRLLRLADLRVFRDYILITARKEH